MLTMSLILKQSSFGVKDAVGSLRSPTQTAVYVYVELIKWGMKSNSSYKPPFM